jgi:hypothetical protein
VFFFVACGELLVLSLTIFVACGELTQLPLLIWAGVLVGRGDLLLVSFFGVFFSSPAASCLFLVSQPSSPAAS